MTTIDITPLVNAILGILATLITAYLVPWLKAKAGAAKANMTSTHLYAYKLIAQTVVSAAAQVYEDNKDKLDYALVLFEQNCTLQNLTYNSEVARGYIEDAVKLLKDSVLLGVSGAETAAET